MRNEVGKIDLTLCLSRMENTERDPEPPIPENFGSSMGGMVPAYYPPHTAQRIPRESGRGLQNTRGEQPATTTTTNVKSGKRGIIQKAATITGSGELEGEKRKGSDKVVPGKSDKLTKSGTFAHTEAPGIGNITKQTHTQAHKENESANIKEITDPENRKKRKPEEPTLEELANANFYPPPMILEKPGPRRQRVTEVRRKSTLILDTEDSKTQVQGAHGQGGQGPPVTGETVPPLLPGALHRVETGGASLIELLITELLAVKRGIGGGGGRASLENVGALGGGGGSGAKSGQRRSTIYIYIY